MSAAAGTVVRVSGARRAFGAVRALDGVDLEVRGGEWLALLGPNGAGKTSLLRAMGGRLTLDAGAVELLGERVDGRPRAAVLRRLGTVSQEIAIYDALTVRENLETFATFHGVARADVAGRVAWALSWTGLDDRARERAGRLSGGMRRRLHIACGVLHRPAVLLLDEPTVGVDADNRERIAVMLDALRRDGAALVHSTHELREVERVADRAAILRHGRVVACAAPRDLAAGGRPRARRVRLTLPAAFAFDPMTLGPGFAFRDGQIVGLLDDPARDLPDLLARLAAAGAVVGDLHVEAPSLEDALASWGASSTAGARA